MGAGTVTVLTDGIADPNGAAALAINQLGDQPSQIANIRVLPIAGQGAAPNVRDLLYLRGVDLAILNSDILTFLDQIRQFPDARRRIRFVTHLFDQKVYLLVRKEIATIEGLRGRKLAILSRSGGSHTTATTLFGLLKIDVALEPLGGPDAILDGITLREFRRRLTADRRTRQGPSQLGGAPGLRALPITLTPALQANISAGRYRGAGTDRPRRCGASRDGYGFDAARRVNWAPSQGAATPTCRISCEALFSALPALRQQHR